MQVQAVQLGQWQSYCWHLPALGLSVLLVLVVGSTLRGLQRDALTHRQRAHRWLRVGFGSLALSLLSLGVVPQLQRVAWIHTQHDGNWSLHNYLGMPLGAISASTVRTLRACDLNGYGVGIGALHIATTTGQSFESVPLTRSRFLAVLQHFGYTRELLSRDYADTLVAPHSFGPSGVQALEPVAPTPLAQTLRLYRSP